MTQIFLASLIFLATTQAFAAKGIILVLNAPLFKKANEKSTIVQYKRKGQEIWIHDKEFAASPYAIDYRLSGGHENSEVKDFSQTQAIVKKQDIDHREFEKFIDSQSTQFKHPSNSLRAGAKNQGQYLKDEFYETLDNNGRTAFIMKKFVKMVYKDKRELTEKIGAFNDYDPTDYRLFEPLPKNYPFSSEIDYRAALAFGLGPQRKRFYRYTQFVAEESYSANGAIELTLLKKIKYDLTDRLYFGAMGSFFNSQSTFILANQDEVEEVKYKVGMGPLISYDIFRYKAYRIIVLGGVTGNMTYADLAYAPASGARERRTFKGLSWEGHLSSLFQRQFFFKNVSLFFKTQFRIILPHKLKTKSERENPAYWNREDDYINYPLGGEFTWFLGFQATL